MSDEFDIAATQPGDAATSHGAEPAAAAVVGSRGGMIGRYMVLGRLGAGAMGVVLAAYDPELDRKVALKLIESRGHDPVAARARLQREAQALARLDHPNVVSVHDVGVHEGRLFVGMEFVAGNTLGAWMEEVEQPRHWRAVLAVFLDAGRGLAAAHAVGLIHRDIKPENIMLGDDGRVRVMDFGLARAAGDAAEVSSTVESTASQQLLVSNLTQTGAMMGTPAYMSLEQFDGLEADARSDQFGFCVALYEALYGERPFVGETIGELLKAVEAGAIRPAPKGSTVPAWLRKAISRGLATNADERWPNMDELLAALADDPAVRRRWWGAAGLAVALLGGGAWGVIAAMKSDTQTCAGMDQHLAGVWDEQRRAQVQQAFEATGSRYAASTGARVEQRLDDYARAWVDAREQACEATHRGEQSGALLDLRIACLDERLVYVDKTVDLLAAADAAVVEKAVDMVAGLPGLDRCADLDALLAEQPPPEDAELAARVEQLDEQIIESQALDAAGKYSEGLELVSAVVEEAVELGYEPLQVRGWARQGDLQYDLGDYEGARETLGQAYDAALGLQMVAAAAEVAASLLVVTGKGQARFDEAECWTRDATPLARAASTDAAQRVLLSNLGVVAQKRGEYEEARSFLERALVVSEQSLGPDHPATATILNDQGVVAMQQGEYEEARGYYERALAIHEEALGPDHPYLAASLENLGITAARTGKYEEARADFERGLEISIAALGPDHPDVANTLNNLGAAAYDAGDYEAVSGYLERALAIRERALGPEHPDVAMTVDNLGVITTKLGKYEEARAYHERALAINEKALGPDHESVGMVLLNLGSLAVKQGDLDAARDYDARALANLESALGSDHPYVALVRVNLAGVLLDQSEPAEAIAHLERALAFYEANEGDPAAPAKARVQLARALWDAPADGGRDRARARSLAEQALATYEAVGEDAAEDARAVRSWIAERGE